MMVMTAMTFCMRDVQYVEWEVYLIAPYSIFIHVKLNFALFYIFTHAYFKFEALAVTKSELKLK